MKRKTFNLNKECFYMVVEFQIDLEDLVAAQTDAYRTTKFHKRNRWILSFAGAIALFIVAIGIIKTDILTATIFSLGLFFFSYYYIYKFSIINQAKKLAGQSHLFANGKFKVTISEEGLFKETKNSTRMIEWNQIKIAKEDNERYIMYLSDIQLEILKKSPDNLSDHDIVKYNELISTYLNRNGLNIKKV